MAFVAGPVPWFNGNNSQEIFNLLWEKLQLLENELQFFRLEERFAQPINPVQDMVVFADGTLWNPGSGRGLYRFDGASWEKI